MKVIVAGYPKTGTKSMAAALRELGYTVHDAIDHFWYNEEAWKRIFSKGTDSIATFKEMYENVDAVTDMPANYFWEEIHKAFPDAKIILSTRDEDKFIVSAVNQFNNARGHAAFQLLLTVTPTGRRYYKQLDDIGRFMFGRSSFFSYSNKNGDNVKDMGKRFRRHQQYCEQHAPKDKLLVYRVSEGWEPLCRFLDKDVPNTPFPFENKGAQIVDKLIETHPALLRMEKEFMILLAASACISGLGGYLVYNKGVLTSISQRISNMFGLNFPI